MEKKYENNLNPEQERYIKEKLLEKYGDTFQKYGMNSIFQTEICNLAEFLITEHPEKYEKNRAIYERDENLQKIYAIINKEKNMAIMINTNEQGKIPEGEFGVFDLQNHKFELTNKEIENKIRETVQKMSNGILTAKEEDEMVKQISPKTLEDIDKMTTMDRQIEDRTKKAVDKKIDEKNTENGKTSEEREKYEKDSKNEQITVGQEKDEQEEKKEIPKDVAEGCRKIGVTQIRGFFYVNAIELSNKIDGTRTNKNGNQVLVIEVYDNKLGCNKYYGFQDERMVLYGNDSEANQAVKDVTGNVTQMGKMIKPLKPKEAQFIEYEDSQGLVIREEIDDQSDLSMQEINRYRDGMEKTLTQYSQEIYLIKNDSLLSDEQKIERIQAIDDWCDKKTTELAMENDISSNDDKNIDAATDEHTRDMQEDIKKEDEPEAFEIPGKREIGE